MKSNTASNGRLDRTNKTKKNDSTPATKQTDNSQKISDQILDPDLRAKVLQLMDVAQCTQDNAFFALHDTDNDVSAAAVLLLEKNNDMQDGWKEQKAKSKKKQQPVTTPAPTESDHTASTEGEADSYKESNNRERSFPRNAPPRLQRNRGSRPEGRFGGPSERRYGGGERGRPRGRGGASRDGFNRSNEGGFGRSRGSDNHNTGEQVDLSTAPQIGTWTSEADANPKTDSWGERWNEDDNQWQGDLKGTHVFESTAKTDTFPTPTEFDPTAVAALPTAVSQSSFQSSSTLNGSSSTQQSSTATSLSIDSLFPKQQVETMAPPTISMYDSQRASDSIKSAIGMPTHQQLTDEAATSKALGHGQQSGMVQAGSGGLAGSQSNHTVPPLMGAQPQRQNKQQRSKVPPPSTKIPTAPVEMPVHTQSNAMMKLGVQFGTMDFDDSSSKLESSGGSGYTPVSIPSTVPQHMSAQQSLQASMFTSGGVSHTPQQSVAGPEPIPYPNSSSQQPSNQSLAPQQNRAALQHSAAGSGSSSLYHNPNLKDNQGSHSGYSNSGNVGSQYKPSQSSHAVSNTQSSLSGQQSGSHPASQSFQSSQASSSGAYYQLPQNLPEKRSGYQTSTQSNVAQANQPASSQATNQYTNSSLYSSSGDQLNVTSSYSHYNSGVSPATSLPSSSPASIPSHVAPVVSSQSQQLPAGTSRSASKQGPPNLPPPVAVTGATPLMPVAPNYIMGGTMPYYGQGAYYTAPTGMEDMQKYQQHQMANNPYYDVPGMNQFMPPASTTFPGTAAAGAGDGKMNRIEAQSPTVQGTQSTGNQSQQAAPTNTQSHQQQQPFMSMPPPGYTNYYFTQMPHGYYQVPPVTQNMSLAGSNTAVYSNQQKGSGGGSSTQYYPTNSGYDDNLQSAHSSDYNKTPYKQQTNSLTGAGSSNTDSASSMYKSANNSGSNAPVATNMYGGGQQATASAYMSAHPAAQAHVLSNQHMMQSQMTPVAQESGVGGRGAQAVNIPKAHSKYYTSGSWAN